MTLTFETVASDLKWFDQVPFASQAELLARLAHRLKEKAAASEKNPVRFEFRPRNPNIDIDTVFGLWRNDDSINADDIYAARTISERDLTFDDE